jgi:class 3 adenylate cyclase
VSLISQKVRYARTSDGFDVAFATYGEGPPLVVPPNILNTHLQLELEYAATRGFYERLSERVQIVRYDGRGTGMSQRGVVDFSVDAGERDLLAVVDRLDLDRFALYSHLMAGDVPMAVAARQARRVTSVVWWVGQTTRVSKETHRQVNAMRALMDSDWELYTNVMGRLVFDWDAPEARIYGELARAGTNPETRRAADEAMARSWRGGVPDIDGVEAPTLIAHLAAVKTSTSLARALAARLPNAHVLAIPGHPQRKMPFVDDNEVLIAAIADFVEATADGAGAPVGPPVLHLGAMRALLWTDIVDHTILMDRYGDAKGREFLREHERITRHELALHGGTEVKAMGDAFMTWFPSAQAALECAIALQRAFASRNAAAEQQIHIRAGVNAGEPIAEDDDLFGTSVIAASRICNEARAGEIVASDVVRQLLAGKEFVFTDRGTVDLKGFQDPVRLHDVRWQT